MATSITIDSYECSACGACVELCPDVFLINELTGKADLVHEDAQINDEVLQAIAYCPEKCILLE